MHYFDMDWPSVFSRQVSSGPLRVAGTALFRTPQRDEAVRRDLPKAAASQRTTKQML